ncbi:pre-mRNA-splicing factor 38B [Nematostella vectensis]|uniref:pre-mRNA-splicing factor 38B n=1 Tax=Nematostella vectensis TaxID=45351 RepID=UPI00138FF73D|nr:pre-mRNA-splicing factor 38B [Nematostella vectensis]
MEAEDFESKQPTKKQNTLPLWGSERTMNMNNMILTNILQSPYFKNELYQLKTYHEVVDEIYYKVDHLEPWEKGSRKTSGQVGMCGGVRGVGAGGIVSTAYCLLYKLFTLRLTRKQLNGLLTHTDSPYIRALGFMYIRYCQPPADLWEWYEPYLEDEEEVDPKAGTGCTMTMGQLVRSFLLKLEWYGTLFPRIPVPIQKDLEKKLKEKNLCDDHKKKADGTWEATQESPNRRPGAENGRENTDRSRRSAESDSRPKRSRSRSRDHSSRRNSRDKSRDPDRDRPRDSERDRYRDIERDRHRDRRHSRDRDRKRSRSRDRRKSRSRSRDRRRSRSRERRRDDRKRRSRERSPKRRSREREESRSRHRGRSNSR